MTQSKYEELYHHGIKGQKWGVRRFQNEDGTLTAEGKQRYYDTTPAGRKHLLSFRNVTKGYKNMDEDGLIKEMDNAYYHDDFDETPEGSKLRKVYDKAYEEYFDTYHEDDAQEEKAMKNFTKAEEDYLKKQYEYIGKTMVNTFGSELVSLYLSEGKEMIDDGEKVIKQIMDEWSYHTE